jgi:hypothetical protein
LAVMACCSQKFHSDCIAKSLRYKAVCPLCNKLHTGTLIGSQPRGTLRLRAVMATIDHAQGTFFAFLPFGVH